MDQVARSSHAPDGTIEYTDDLNIAATCPATRALGPGIRAVVWVQGCVFHCPGCVAPDWIPIRPARFVRPEELADELLADPRVTGLTFSGGEPMIQAAGLARLARVARSRRDVDIICYTGFPRGLLVDTPPGPGVSDLLEQVDVLIDGPFIDRLNDNRGMRGSSNQRVHYLTDRLKGYDFENQHRVAEIHLLEGQAMVVGVPARHFKEAFELAMDQAVNSVVQGKERRIRYERV